MMDRKTVSLFSPLSLWALSLGCCTGWGAFIMPGTLFLPSAGPLGSTIALVLGAAAMIVIAANYHFMMYKNEGAGGPFDYLVDVFGYDHAFLCAWFLWLVYMAIMWANVTAFVLIGRNFFGPVLEFGFHYTVAGFDVYFGEACLSVSILILFALVSIWKPRFAILCNTICGLGLFFGAIACFALAHNRLPHELFSPPFVADVSIIRQILSIVALAPWAFVGFEALCHVTGEFRCSRRYSFILLTLGVVSSACVYIVLILLATLPLPRGVENWVGYIKELPNILGMAGIPTFYAMKLSYQDLGIALMVLTIVCALSTSLFGLYKVTSALTCAMAEKGVFPALFAKREKNGAPKNAILLILFVSVFVPFMGRTAIGWIVDITTVGATIAYGYVSACAWVAARREGRLLYQATGFLGLIIALLFCLCLLMPNFWNLSSLAMESYLILATWSVIGFVFFLFIFSFDREEHFGKSTVVWIVLLFFIFFSSLMWMREATHISTQTIVNNVNKYYSDHLKSYNIYVNGEQRADADNYIEGQIDILRESLVDHSIVQMVLILLSIGVVFLVYSSMSSRRKKLELEKMRIEEISKSKTTFLSNMSHDIRTPMNAIIGFTDLALRNDSDPETVKDYLNKIKLSSNHLLSLINDVLEMSRIESGKIEIQESIVSIPSILHDLSTIIMGQAEAKQHELSLNAMRIKNEKIYCDKLRLNQMFLNILSNSIKYTPSGGKIFVSLEQMGPAKEGIADYEIRVKDNGIGMSPEFAAKIFEAFERENTTTVSGIQGTGLGMAITKRIVDLMHGDIRIVTEPDKGTEFIVHIPFRVADEEEALPSALNLSHLHALVVDDDYGACDGVTSILSDLGIRTEWTMSAKEAVLRVRKSIADKDPFSLFLIDWKLPVTNGLEVAREIQSLMHNEATIILITAYDWMTIKDDALKVGIHEYCTKPVFASELRNVICRAIGMHTSEKEEEQTTEQLDFTGKRLLLVDDVDVNREIADAVLSMSGFKVEEAVNGEEAVHMVEASEPGYYDAVLMDVQMPVMNGYEATKAIRELHNPALARIPIIAMTANAFDEDRKAAFNAGMDGHIAKPIDVHVVLATLSKIISRN